MKEQIELIKKIRGNFISLINSLSIEEANLIPKGYNNNILWNYGHAIVSQQGLCYGMAELPLNVEADIMSKYRKGSKPETFINTAEFEILNELSISLLDTFEKDIEKGIFKNYKPYMTSLGYEITNFEQAIQFNTYHESLHWGYSMSLKRAIQNSSFYILKP